jgi:subtilisin family serine protease
VQRIEAVTPDGVGSTEGLPAEQQVVVGVIDSGIDATHPDINYVGGQSWAANDAKPDYDGFGARLSLLSLLPPVLVALSHACPVCA